MSREGMVLEKNVVCPVCRRKRCWLLGDGETYRCCKGGHRFSLK